MQNFIAKLLLFLVALTVAVPESYAKRAGGGRSVGRQSQVLRQRTAPPPAPRQQPAVPPAVQPRPGQQQASPALPAQQIRRQASSPWGGMLAGALIGLGLGSLVTSGDAQADTASQSEGGQAEGETAAGSAASQTEVAPSGELPQENSLGRVFVLGLLVLGVYFLVRRKRSRSRIQSRSRQ